MNDKSKPGGADTALALLRWYVEMGVDETIGDEPVNRLAPPVPPRASAIRPTELEAAPPQSVRPVPASPPALFADSLGEAAQSARLLAARADTLATIYHGCQRYMCVFEAERQITVEHYLTVFGRGLGIEFEDRFKKFRLRQDPSACSPRPRPASARTMSMSSGPARS
jgi:hypothetical protein